MKRLTIILILLIIALSVTLTYYVIRINNLKNLVGLKRHTDQLLTETLESKVKTLRDYSISLDKLNNDLANISALEFLPTDKLPTNTAIPYYDNFLKNRGAGDSTQVILFDWPKIIQGMKEIYNVTAGQWDSLAYWSDKGFIIYPANYGATGDPFGQHIGQTTALFQFARKDSTTVEPNDWEGLPNSDGTLYNFGDLKPPKKGLIK